MKFSKLFFLFVLFFCGIQFCCAEDIRIASFDELINSAPENGDVLILTDNLTSDSSIGTYFNNLAVTFEGNNYYINGNNTFSGFNFNAETRFNQVDVRNCRGQRYGGYSYAGAIYNNGSELSIFRSAFDDNFVNANGLNLGSGGAIYNINGGNVNIDTALFENNYTSGARSYGGAIANDFTGGTPTVMTINNSVFRNNYSEGSVLPTGGAIYNTGTINITNTEFEDNRTFGDESLASYGGVIYNTGTANFKDSTITNNSSSGGAMSIVRGGAMYNGGSLIIDNTHVSGNHTDAEFYGDGGAIYNDTSGTTVIRNSVIENNYVNSNSGYSEGGGIANAGTVSIENSVLQNNRKGDTKNDIYNYATGTVNFSGDGTTTILSGIAGSGKLNKTDNGVLNLGGENSLFTGNFDFTGGTLNLLQNSSYFSAENTFFGNGTNFNMQNGAIDSVNFGNLTLSGKTDISADVNLSDQTMDRISADSLTGNGILHLSSLSIEGTPKQSRISIPFANSVIKDYVEYTPEIIQSPIYDYSLSYNSSDGNLNFARGGFNSSVLIPAVAAQLAGYLTQIDTYKRVFSNLDMVMILSPDKIAGFDSRNKMADANGSFAFSPLMIPEERKGIWIKPYSTFENVPLRGGARVSNISYGTLIGGESELKKLQRGWYALYGAYLSYNGSHQTYGGNGIYNNGGLGGVDAVFYKGGFFSAWTANAGANSAEGSTMFGKQNFVMLNAGIAEKTGYNVALLDRRLILQPSLLMSYSFINTFDYTTDYNVNINAEPLHAIHIEPQLKIIGNFKNYLQPYLSVSMIWNVIDNTRFQANTVYLPELSVKPFVEYGVGVQKRWGDRFTGFLEGMIRNGGRNGIALQFGLRISI